MRRQFRSVILALVLLVSPQSLALAGSPVGIGVLGDSYSDEYQFYPPDRASARNWVEILATVSGLDFGRFSTVSRGEPRNQGYAFNWARSDATTDDLIALGQHTGLAAQVSSGEVGLAVIFIGGNDFINALKTPDPTARLAEVLPRAIANHRTAVQTILAADPRVKLVLVTLPDIRHLPEFAGPLRAGRLSTAVMSAFTRAISRYNFQIRSLAASDPRLALVDLDLATKAANVISTDAVFVAGRKLDRLNPGNDLDRFFLGDVRHPGTLGQSLMVRMFIEAVNARFAAGIAPLDSQEVLALARSIAPARDHNLAVVRLDRAESAAPRAK